MKDFPALYWSENLRITVLAFVCACAVFAGCSKETPVGPPAVVIPGDSEKIIYSKHIQPIWQNSCGGAGCHLNGQFAIADSFAMDSWQAVMSGSTFGALVIPYNGTKSHLFEHINTDTTLGAIATPHMPLSRDPLPIAQIKLIKRWIDEGAQNDDGQVWLSGARPRAFVTNQGEDLVAAIDLATGHIARYISVGANPNNTTPEAPHNITVSPDNKYFYVNLIAAGLIEKYDAATFAKLGSTRVGLSPAQIVTTADGSALYVSNFDLTFTQHFINRVDAATMTVTDSIDMSGNAPHGVTLGVGEKLIYTINAGSDDISEIDLRTKLITRKIPIVPNQPLPNLSPAIHMPYQAVIDKIGNTMFVSCRKSGQVRVVDLLAGQVVDSITVGAAPLVLNITPDGREVWVPVQGTNSLAIIDVATRKVIFTIPGLRVQPHAVGFTSDGKTAFISCENQAGGADLHHPVEGSKIPGIVYEYDVATRTQIRKIETGAFAAGVAVMK